MKEEILEALELEKSKREILKLNQKKTPPSLNQSHEEKRQFAWEIELEQYRKQKNKEKFWTIGAICGVLALILQIMLNYEQILSYLI